nr:K(+) efflux antiporter 3, chloroplastic [Tanacetum cinerariifolium]
MTSNESHREPMIAQAEGRKRLAVDDSGNILTARTGVKKQKVEVNANGDLALKKRPKDHVLANIDESDINNELAEAVAEARSPDAFVALCLLTVAGTSLITQKLGFSDTNLVGESILPMLVKESLKALGGLGLLSFGGKFFLRRIFEAVAEARSLEAFVALCLLTVAGTSLITQKLGFSDTV